VVQRILLYDVEVEGSKRSLMSGFEAREVDLLITSNCSFTELSSNAMMLYYIGELEVVSSSYIGVHFSRLKNLSFETTKDKEALHFTFTQLVLRLSTSSRIQP
jgi:hypothetical protein